MKEKTADKHVIVSEKLAFMRIICPKKGAEQGELTMSFPYSKPEFCGHCGEKIEPASQASTAKS